MTNSRLPLALIILDGWGVAAKADGNALALAHTPNYDEICARYPSVNLQPPAKASDYQPKLLAVLKRATSILGPDASCRPTSRVWRVRSAAANSTTTQCSARHCPEPRPLASPST
jgi:hypothetical protein